MAENSEKFTRKKGGRPKKQANQRAERMLQIRMDPEDYKELLNRKSATSARSVSDFVRSVCLGKPLVLLNEVSTQDEKVLSLVREIRIELVRIGVNINQSVKRINSTTDYYDLRKETLILGEKVAALETRIDSLLAAMKM